MKKILLAGGDIRTRILYGKLKEAGFTVDTVGLFEDDNGDMGSADIIILPIPVSRDKKNINCPLTDRVIPISHITENAGNKTVLGGGAIGLINNYTDYSLSDSYAILNAVPTAEGAIAAAINNTDITLQKSKVLLIGFGRVGKVLSTRLSAMHCELTVSARSPADKALIDALGIKHIDTKDIGLCESFDIIFNTVDYPVLDSALDNLDGTLIIDLSTAGCIDEATALKYNAKYLKLPGIPGKTAPVTAGEILFETVSDILKQKGEYS